MKIFRQIGFAVWMFFNLHRLSYCKKAIVKAKKLLDYKTEQEQILETTKEWGASIVNHYGIKVDVEGEKTLPEGPVLFVSNHEGYADIVVFMVGITTKQFGFVAKEELAKIPVFGKWILRIRSIMISRGDARETIKTFKTGEEMIKQGFSLVIFPEGTRSKNKGMAPFNKGSLKMATKTGVPIVPVSIKGTWALFEKNGFPSAGLVHFYVHEAVNTEGITKAEEAALSDKIERTIRDKLMEWENN